MANKDKIATISKALRELADSIEEALGEEAETETKAAEVKKETKTDEPEKTEEPKYTLADVRKTLAAKSGAGYTDEVRELLKRHGASKLSAVPESDYPAVMEEAEAIGTAQ